MEQHQKYMWRAIDLARRAEAQSISPNPAVGAVLVYKDRIIGEGYHQKVGDSHAEVHCLQSVHPKDINYIPQSTLYVTLEPCAHEGRTPSCAKRIIKEGIKKIFIGTLDPNPLTAGKGIHILQETGAEVTTGLLEEECKEVAKIFLCNQINQRPYVTLKWAESSDGFIDHYRNSNATPPAQISSPFSQLLVHQLRSQYSGILVGSHTHSLDTPKLNNRLWLPSSYSPRPILLSSKKHNLPPHWLQIQELTMEVLQQLLQEEGITSLLVEGGNITLHSFIKQGLWDEIRREVAPTLLHSGIPAPMLPLEATLSEELNLPQNHIIYTYKKNEI